MTRMQRLQPWLMSGIAFFALSVGLIGLQLNLGRNASSSGPVDFLSRMNLALYAYGLIVLGSFLILWERSLNTLLLLRSAVAGKGAAVAKRPRSAVRANAPRMGAFDVVVQAAKTFSTRHRESLNRTKSGIILNPLFSKKGRTILSRPNKTSWA